MYFHSPLGLRERAPQPETRIDVLPLVSACLIALMLSLAGSRFIFAPGLFTELDVGTASAKPPDKTEGAAPAPMRLDLPRSSQSALPGAMTDVTLVVTTRDDLAFFNGRRYNIGDSELRQAMADAARQHGGNAVLLLAVDKTLSAERIFQLTDYAREAGFRAVNLAAQTTRR
ncbi:MAG: biopolymer transporter ExbD [Puniceicoccales bacterium]|jgi:biopolymer transport protein ExbD|nr:biopolymer transporter ExbD [Puniceicoccales bacterium]